MLKRSLTLLPLFGIIFFTVCGGSFGIEPLFGAAGPGMALLLIGVLPFAYSLPNIFMVRELQSMMPVEGGYYHWTKQAFGPFTGFLTGWMNWVMSWVDVAIYPVLAATYLSFFIPALDTGAGGVPGWVLEWLVAIVFIWLISGMQVWGSRFTGLTSIWMGAILYIPLIIMSVVGFVNWGTQGSSFHMTFLPPETGHHRRVQPRAVRGHVELHGLRTAHDRRRRDSQAQTDVPVGHGTGPHSRDRNLLHPDGGRTLRRRRRRRPSVRSGGSKNPSRARGSAPT